jgi:hypothetical protein
MIRVAEIVVLATVANDLSLSVDQHRQNSTDSLQSWQASLPGIARALLRS